MNNTTALIATAIVATIGLSTVGPSLFAQTESTVLILTNKNAKVLFDGEEKGTAEANTPFKISSPSGEHYAQAHADVSRRGRRNPRHPILIAECKFFSASAVSIGLARALVELISDFRPKLGGTFISNSATDNLKKYLSNKNKPTPFTDLSPLDSHTEDRFIRRTETKLRQGAAV